MSRQHTISRPFIVKSILFIFGMLAITGTRAIAQGDLLISPLRVLFDGTAKRSQEINLANVGKDTASYIISIVDYRMKEDGSFDQVTVPDSGQNFAGPFLRYFPRKVTLAPNEAQVVKIQIIKTNELLPGEYRSHLYFRSVPDERPLGEKPAKKDTSAILIQLTPIFGITIPVIIRVGENNTDVTISNVFFFTKDSAKKPMLHMTFNRTGNMSAYGEVKVEYIAKNGKTTKVGLAKGVGVYTPNPARSLNVELSGDAGIDYHSGKLHVTYTLQTSDKSAKVVEADVELK